MESRENGHLAEPHENRSQRFYRYNIASVIFERASPAVETLSLFWLLPWVFMNGTISVVLWHKDPPVPCPETKDRVGQILNMDDPGQKDSH
jgi:hypothetical protein